jgi:hypothetical protein
VNRRDAELAILMAEGDPGAELDSMTLEAAGLHVLARAQRAREPEQLVDLPGIDWPATMRESLAEVSVLTDRIATTDSAVGEAIARLLNAVTWLVDENARLVTRADAQNRLIQGVLEWESVAILKGLES